MIRIIVMLLLASIVMMPQSLDADMVSVEYAEGLSHGFLILRQQDGTQLADGESTQVGHADRIKSHLAFRFKDGSLYDDTTIFTQRGTFRLVSDHVIQKGSAFKKPMETSIDAATGRVTVRYIKDDKGQSSTEHVDLPPDVGKKNDLYARQRPEVHSNDVFLRRYHAKVENYKVDPHAAEDEPFVNWPDRTPSQALRHEGPDWRRGGRCGPHNWEAALRYTDLDSGWRSSNVC